MKKSDMKNVYGKAPKSFHYAVMRSLNSLEEKQQVKSRSRLMRTLIACALVAAIGVAGVVTAKAVYPMVVNRQGNYGVSIELEPQTASDTESSNELELSLNENLSAPEYVKMELGYMPEGVIENQGKYSLDGNFKEKGFTFVCERIAEKTAITDENILDYEQFEVNGNAAVLAHVSVDPYSKRFYIYFEDYAFFVKCYVTKDVSDEEIKKVMENITVTEGTEDDNSGGSLSESKQSLGDKISGALEEANQQAYDAWLEANTEVTFSTVELKQTLGYECPKLDEATGIDFSIDDIEVLDNIADLDANCFEQDRSENIGSYADENGNLLPYTRETIKYGDGVDSVNEIVASETVNRRLVYVTVNVRNTSDTEREFYLYQLNIDRLRDNNGVLGYPTGDEVLPELASCGEINFIDNNDVEKSGYSSGYYFLTVPANSSETVHLGFLADEDMLDELYVTVDGRWCGAIFDAESGKFVNNDKETEFGYACIKVQ